MVYLLQYIEVEESSFAKPYLEALQEILEEFNDVFATPHELPPSRLYDHRIPLHYSNLMANVRPYKYPFHQTNEIEKQVQDMLSMVIIQPNVSSFTSSAVIVWKADGSSHLCVDYPKA